MKKRVPRKRELAHPLSRIPPEKKRELNFILHNKETISVFTDCSASPGIYNLGLGASFIGYSDITVRSQKYATELETATMYGELKAITFAIKNLPKILEKYQRLMIKPHKIVIYTDCEHIKKVHELLLSSNNHMREAMEEMIVEKNNFNQSNPNYLLDIKYLGGDKKDHLYHRMAHSAARNILQK